MRKTRKQLVGKMENAEHLAREQELRALTHTLHQQWRWQRRAYNATTEYVVIPA